MDEDMFVDDLYDMEDEQLQHEADRYARLARHGADHPKVEYRFAYRRHHAALELLKVRSRK
jgi:hypothetical protein